MRFKPTHPLFLSLIGIAALAILFGVVNLVDDDDKVAVAVPEALPGVAVVEARSYPAEAAQSPTNCNFQPLLPASTAGDGQFRLAGEAHPSSGDAYARVADEAALEGRQRDAEVALIRACQVAAASPAKAHSADAMVRLAQHYGQSTRAFGDPQSRSAQEVFRRSQELLDGARRIYADERGHGDASTVRVAGWIATLTRVGALQAQGRPLLPAPRVQVAGRSIESEQGEPDTATMGARPATMLPPVGVNLAQADSDLSRLRAQARAVTRDPGGFARREQAAEASRARCQDEACLARWYRGRRAQLLAEF